MKAVILAAGYATRLYPLTLNQPKHLLKVNGRNILDYSMDLMENIPGIKQVYLVTNNKFYCNFLDWKAKAHFSKQIKVVNDNTIENQTKLGAIGDLSFVIDSENLDDDLLVIAGDNIFEVGLAELIREFEKEKKDMIAVYDVKDLKLARLYGIVELNAEGIVSNFVEKPPQPKSTLASTGIYLFPREHIKHIRQYLDAGNDADKLGNYVSWLYRQEEVLAFTLQGRWFDIGDKSQLKEADEYFRRKSGKDPV